MKVKKIKKKRKMNLLKRIKNEEILTKRKDEEKKEEVLKGRDDVKSI